MAAKKKETLEVEEGNDELVGEYKLAPQAAHSFHHDFETGLTINRNDVVELKANDIGTATRLAIANNKLVRVFKKA